MRNMLVVFDFKKLSAMPKVGFANNVIDRMTENATRFQSPDVPIADLINLTSRFSQSVTDAMDGGRLKVMEMNILKKEMDDMLTKQARYVDRIADGHPEIVLCSGFNLIKDPSPRQRVELIIENGKVPGSVKLRRQAVTGAKTYVWQHAVGLLPETDEQWIISGYSRKASFEIDDLQPTSKVWFRVAAVIDEGTEPFCDPIMKIIV